MVPEDTLCRPPPRDGREDDPAPDGCWRVKVPDSGHAGIDEGLRRDSRELTSAATVIASLDSGPATRGSEQVQGSTGGGESSAAVVVEELVDDSAAARSLTVTIKDYGYDWVTKGGTTGRHMSYWWGAATRRTLNNIVTTSRSQGHRETERVRPEAASSCRAVAHQNERGSLSMRSGQSGVSENATPSLVYMAGGHQQVTYQMVPPYAPEVKP